MRKIIFFILLSAYGTTSLALAQDLAGDWIGQMNGGFKVRIHFEMSGPRFSGKLINPSGNETVLDQITSDGTTFALCSEQAQLELRRDME